MFQLGLFFCVLLCAFQNQVNGFTSMPIPGNFGESMNGFVGPSIGPSGASLTNEGAAWLGAVPNVAYGLGGAGLFGNIAGAPYGLVPGGLPFNYNPYPGYNQGFSMNNLPKMWEDVYNQDSLEEYVEPQPDLSFMKK